MASTMKALLLLLPTSHSVKRHDGRSVCTFLHIDRHKHSLPNRTMVPFPAEHYCILTILPGGSATPRPWSPQCQRPLYRGISTTGTIPTSATTTRSSRHRIPSLWRTRSIPSFRQTLRRLPLTHANFQSNLPPKKLPSRAKRLCSLGPPTKTTSSVGTYKDTDSRAGPCWLKNACRAVEENSAANDGSISWIRTLIGRAGGSRKISFYCKV